MRVLKKTIRLKIRFSEVDAMRIVWHGAYAKYFEDAREAFGSEFQLGYDLIAENGFYAPLVDFSIQYKQPLRYGMCPEITIVYKATEAAKIVFEYEIRNPEDNSLMTTGRSVQVFMDGDYQLVWSTPEFYEEWKKCWGQSST